MIGLVLAAAAATAPAPGGKVVFEAWCAPCHAPVVPGVRLPGTTALELRYKGERPAALEQRTDLTPELVRFFVRTGVKSMPPFRRTEISDAELELLGRYLARPR